MFEEKFIDDKDEVDDDDGRLEVIAKPHSQINEWCSDVHASIGLMNDEVMSMRVSPKEPWLTCILIIFSKLSSSIDNRLFYLGK